jgi:superfamily II DNA/RNA helicase
MPYNSRLRRPAGGSTRAYSAKPSKRQNNKDYINPSRFIKAARSVEIEVEAYVPQSQFADFALNQTLQANVTAHGFVTPSPIQDQAIPVGLSGRDVIGIANTGTGKTIAFALPILEKLMADRTSRALIMAPTRELALQIEDECRLIAKGSGLGAAMLIGGTAMSPQLKDLSHNPSIVIGTPGRIKDHMQRGSLRLANVNMIVLDEVDRMLDMGFVNDMRYILAEVSPVRQSFFFSATLDDRVRTLINDFSNDPVHISVKTGVTVDSVEQNIITYSSMDEKLDKLHDLLISQGVTKALVFDETQHRVERLSQKLQERGFMADAIHGGKSQAQRQRALSGFKANQINVLVATDVAARGIDVADISHVINYSPPKTYDDYVHRIGRTGRAGRTGNALTFVASQSVR